jgi:hypothetical protein
MTWIATPVMLILLGFFSKGLCDEIPEFNQDRAYQDLLTQCDFGPRNPGSDGHRECGEWMIETLYQLTGDVVPQHFSFVSRARKDTMRLMNVIARFQTHLKEKVVLGAHWDTRPWANLDPNPEFRNTPILGANDGASGVAVLLELARLFSQYPPPVCVELVFFDGEDAGIDGSLDEWALGSRYYGMTLTGELPRWGVVVDMIGEIDAVYSVEPQSQELAPRLVQTLWGIAEELQIYNFDPNTGPAVWDDHVMLNRYGIPSVDIIDFDYRYWHTLEDTPDKCSPQSLDNVGTVLVHWIYSGAQVSP